MCLFTIYLESNTNNTPHALVLSSFKNILINDLLKIQ